MGTELLSDAVDEQLDPATAGTAHGIDILIHAGLLWPRPAVGPGWATGPGGLAPAAARIQEFGTVPGYSLAVRILHVTDRLSDRGGAYLQTLGLVDGLVADHEQWLAVEEIDASVEAACPVQLVQGLAARTRTPHGLDLLCDRIAPDVVHIHNVVNPAVLEWAAARPTLVSIHDHRFFCPGRGKWTLEGKVCQDTMVRTTCAPCFSDEAYFHAMYRVTEERLTALRPLRVMVPSTYMARELEGAGHSPEQIHVLPPFVWGLDHGQSPENRTTVLFVGRLAEAKGVADAVEAWRRWNPGLPLVLAGTGPLRQEMEAAGAQVLGWVRHREMAALYRQAAVVLFPSRWQEPFGLAGLEALTLGTPVAAWDSGGVAEWYRGGGLVRWGDVNGLAHAAARLAGQPTAPPEGFERSRHISRLLSLYKDRYENRVPGLPGGAQ